MMDRSEHLEELDIGPGGWVTAISSIHMDFSLHPELRDHDGLMLMPTLALS